MFKKIYPELDLVWYRKCQGTFAVASDVLCYLDFHTRVLRGQKDVCVYPHKSIRSLSLNGGILREIRTKDDIERLRPLLGSYIEGYTEPNITIYNRASFFKIYPDFNIEYYREKYLTPTTPEIDVCAHFHCVGRFRRYVTSPTRFIFVYSMIYHSHTGGIIGLHHLVQKINELNFPNLRAKLLNPFEIRYTNPFSDAFAFLHEINENAIVVYPEIVYNDFLEAHHVIRWILLGLGIEMPIDHYRTWSPDDLVYFWEPDGVHPTRFQLCTPWFDPIFKNVNPDNPRTQSCFMVKKGPLIHKNGITFFHPPDAVEINDYCVTNQQSDYSDFLCKLFNVCEYFYTYDPNTMFIFFAAICGCIPVVYPIHGVSKNEYLSTRMTRCGDTVHDFIAYGNHPKEMARAKKAIRDIRSIMGAIESYHDASLRSVVTSIQKFLETGLYKDTNTVAKLFLGQTTC